MRHPRLYPALSPTLGVLTLVSMLSLPVLARAEESLLWKSVSNVPAVVVPAYGGAPSPFPSVAQPAAEVSATTESDEKRRLRDDAFAAAQRLVESGDALMPDMRSLSVGGFVEGTLGSRVLLGNQWVAVGTSVQVSQHKSPQAVEAVKSLAEYDTGAAQDLTTRLNTNLFLHPVMVLKVERITSNTLEFSSPRGKQGIKFNINSN